MQTRPEPLAYLFFSGNSHEVGQQLDAFDGHGVVDRRAAAADGAMALQFAQPAPPPA